MLIRPANASDLPNIRNLHVENWRSDYKGVLPDDVLGPQLSDDMAARWSQLPEAPDFVLVAEQEECFIGFGLVRPAHDEGPFLESLHVSADSRGLGAGRLLFAALAVSLYQAGHTKLWLEVLEKNTLARRFYVRLGGLEGPPIIEVLLDRPIPARKVLWTDLSAFAQ